MLLTAGVAGAENSNLLRGPLATVMAPAGVSYDAALSVTAGMEVFRSGSSGLLFALGGDSRLNGDAAGLASALGRRMGAVPQRIDSDGTRVYTVIGSRRMYALTDCRDGRSVAVLLVIGDFTPRQALAFARSLRPRC